MKPAAAINAITFVVANISSLCFAQNQLEKAGMCVDDLRFSSYATSRHVQQLAVDEAVRAQAWQTILRMGITRLYIEVYRGGHVVSQEHLIFVRDWLRDRGLDVVGGIATVPGSNFGVRQKGPLGWFNWQNRKTQRDIEKVIRMAAGVFDTFIVDDFLCTGDISAESKIAKGSRSWGRYRRELITELAESVFVEPARQVNPDITMIVKYPQWYDRFHLFGYDTKTLPRIFDKVWVGTETRGRNTQRFGFVQPYEGFVNYRWLAAVAGDKIGGAWFDHGDCREYDFLDQTYMSVLAGAPELVFFNFNNIVQGHPDHEKVISEFDRLAELAAFVREHPVIGIPAYKPPNSDPSGDMYIMDFIGMLGIPLIPVHEFPENAPIIFLPAQAASDPNLLYHIEKARARGAHLIVTTSLLIASPELNEITRIQGITRKIESNPIRARLLTSSPKTDKLESANVMIDLESPIDFIPKPTDIVCTAAGKKLLLLCVTETPKGRITLLNTHTYNQADFDAVGEVLLCPRPLGLLDICGSTLSKFRAALNDTIVTEKKTFMQEPLFPVLRGPGCVTIHPFENGDCVVQNFNDKQVRSTVTVHIPENKSNRFIDGFTQKPIPALKSDSKSTVSLDLVIAARGRAWIRHVDFDVDDR
jgi:hypothetical protein